MAKTKDRQLDDAINRILDTLWNWKTSRLIIPSGREVAQVITTEDFSRLYKSIVEVSELVGLEDDESQLRAVQVSRVA